MGIFVIAVIKERKQTIGYRLLDTISGQTKDTGAKILSDVLKAGKVNIENIEIKDNCIVGKNGSLDRYSVISRDGKLSGSSNIVILEEIGTAGYKASNYSGTVGNYKTADIIRFAKQKKCGIANGKVVEKDGKEFISSIRGEYDEADIKREIEKHEDKKYNNSAEDEKTEVIGDGTFTDEIKNKIEKIKTLKNYVGSFDEMVVNTIIKYNKCSPKQKAVIDRAYDKAFGSKQEDANKITVSGNIPAPVITKEADKSIDEYREKEEKYQNYVDNSNQYKLLTGKHERGVYITGIDNRKYNGKIVIPEKIDGQDIYGIAPEAFKDTYISAVVVAKNVNDIGYGAFSGCISLEVVDLSETIIAFIPHHMCYGCSRLKTVVLNPYIGKIHESAFALCYRLNTINLLNTAEIAGKAFYKCSELETVKHNCKINRLAQGAFEECYRLTSYDFTGLQVIGASAFKFSGLEKADIPGTVRDIGNSAFYGCFALQRVDINEGVDSCGEYCFCKIVQGRIAIAAAIAMDKLDEQAELIVSTPKSLINIANHCFDSVKAVEVWTGSGAESYCLAFNNEMIYKDGVDTNNSANARIMSAPLGADIIEQIDSILNKEVDGVSNPDIKLNESNLINVKLTQGIADILHLDYTEQTKEPHAKFIGAVNYLTSVSTLYVTPLKQGVMRLADTIDIESQAIFTDGVNAIYKITYVTKDLQDNGSIILVVINGVVRYVTECNIKTDIKMTEYIGTTNRIPIVYLHVGDTIGKAYCVAGQAKPFNAVINRFGERLLQRFIDNGIMIEESIKNKLLYIPAVGKALHLVDDRKYDKDGKVLKHTPDCLKIKGIYEEKEFISKMKQLSKSVKSDRDYFDKLEKMSSYHVEKRVKEINIVPEEHISPLYYTAKEVYDTFVRLGSDMISPSDLSIDTINGILNSYYMVEKDVEWFNNTGKKSLNKLGEYSLGNGRKLVEYRSNQVVKFYNPYMAGCKGAYVFTLVSGSSVYAVYASVHNIGKIIGMLKLMATLPPSGDGNNYPELMQDRLIDMVDARLFYDFYDLLYSKGGWSTNKFDNGFKTYVYDGFNFKISMYKPTGVFYIVAKMFSKVKVRNAQKGIDEEIVAKLALPIFKVGDMDRALMVASTTNQSASKSRLLEILVHVVQCAHTKSIPSKGYNQDYLNCLAARELAINGDSNVNDYIPLIGNRLVYMIGTTAKQLSIASNNRYYDMEESEMILEDEYTVDYDMGEMEIGEDDVSEFLDEDTDIEYNYSIDEDILDEEEEYVEEYEDEEYEEEYINSDDSEVSDVLLKELQRIQEETK